MESREERPKGKAKKSSKDKPKALQTPEPADSNLQVEIENDLYESPEPEGYGPESTHQNETKIRSCGSKKLEINRDTDTRELMRPRPGPSDLRYSNLQPNKELREVMKPKPLSCTEKQRNERDKDAYDSFTEGEVESSEDKLPPEDELTNVLFSENENNVSTPLPGPSRTRSDQTKIPGPPTKS